MAELSSMVKDILIFVDMNPQSLWKIIGVGKGILVNLMKVFVWR